GLRMRRPSAAAVSSLRLPPDLLIAEFQACSIHPDSRVPLALPVRLPPFPHTVRLPAVRLPDQRSLSALSSAQHSSPPVARSRSHSMRARSGLSAAPSAPRWPP